MQKILEDMIRRAEVTGRVYTSDFVKGSELREAKPSGNFVISGGVPDCEREMFFALPEFIRAETFDVSEYIAVVKIMPNDGGKYSHRDYLGSLMALQVDRGKTGDIVTTENCAYLLCASHLSAFIADNLREVSRTGCCCKTVPLSAVPKGEDDGERMIVSVASMRLDCLVGEFAHVVRSKAQELIASKCVTVDKHVCEKPDKQVAVGAVVSVRRFGRFTVTGIVGESKRGKLRVEMLRRS